jgi:hypothetical protein
MFMEEHGKVTDISYQKLILQIKNYAQANFYK